MRNANIVQVVRSQAVQRGPHLLALASLLKCIPASPDEAGDLPGRHGGLSRYCYSAHGGLSLGVVSTHRMPRLELARFTCSLHFRHRQLIFASSACWSRDFQPLLGRRAACATSSRIALWT